MKSSIKKLINKQFKKLFKMCKNCKNCNCGNFTYIGFATDASGSNFSLNRTAGNIQRCFQATITSSTELDVNAPTFKNYFFQRWINICKPNFSLDKIDPKCLTSKNIWGVMTDEQRFQLIVDELCKLKSCITCTGGSSSTTSGSGGGAGIGGSLIEAWANAKQFIHQSNNSYFCGGAFGALRLIKFMDKIYFSVDFSNFKNFNGSITLFMMNGGVSTTKVIPVVFSGNSSMVKTITGEFISNVAQQDIYSVVISASTYQSLNGTLCTQGSITLN